MDHFWNFEPLYSSLRQNLASVGSRKVTKEISFWRSFMHLMHGAGNVKILSNLKLNQNREVLSYNDVQPSVGKFLARTLQLEFLFFMVFGVDPSGSNKEKIMKFITCLMSKSTTADIITAFADLVKVSRKITSFDFWTTNMMKFLQKIFFLRTTPLNAQFMKFEGGGPTGTPD